VAFVIYLSSGCAGSRRATLKKFLGVFLANDVASSDSKRSDFTALNQIVNVRD
jgi:hypothetical protein